MRTEKEIKEVRAGLMHQLEDLESQVQGRSLTDEESQKWDAIFADVQKLNKELDRNAKLAEQRALIADQGSQKADEQNNTTADYREVFNKWMRRGMGKLTAAERDMMEKRGTDPQGVSTDALGGYAVPEAFGDQLIKAMAVYGGMLEVATITTTNSGANMPFPTLDETAVTGVRVGENTQIAVNDITLGTVPLSAYVYSSGIVKMSLQLLQDDGVNLEGELSGIFADRIGRIVNADLTAGDGSAKPTGLLEGISNGKTATAVDAVTRDEIVDLIYSVDRAYRGNSRFMLHDSTLAALRKIDLGTGDARPLWQPSIRVGEPDTLEGYSYTVNNDMPELGAGNTPIAFGDFSKFRVRMVRQMGMVTFDEKYMDFLQKGYMAWLRLDGRLLDTKAVKVLTNAAS
jgi:HK97 family phage major capsid protein